MGHMTTASSQPVGQNKVVPLKISFLLKKYILQQNYENKMIANLLNNPYISINC